MWDQKAASLADLQKVCVAVVIKEKRKSKKKEWNQERKEAELEEKYGLFIQQIRPDQEICYIVKRYAFSLFPEFHCPV